MRAWEKSGGRCMKETKRKNIHELPYSLHDAHMNKINIKGDTVEISFQNGYYMPSGKHAESVEGYLEFNGVDLDFCYVYILCTAGWQGKKFTAKKYSLKKFIHKYPELDMEIIDETYGFNQSVFKGYMYKSKKTKEFFMELYHLGDMKYITKF